MRSDREILAEVLQVLRRVMVRPDDSINGYDAILIIKDLIAEIHEVFSLHENRVLQGLPPMPEGYTLISTQIMPRDYWRGISVLLPRNNAYECVFTRLSPYASNESLLRTYPDAMFYKL